MEHSIIIDFVKGFAGVEFYFEIQGERIFLCKVLSGDIYNVMDIRKVCISLNPAYASWLQFHSGTYFKGTENEITELHHLFDNNHWFVSNEHRQFDKYIKELKYHIEQLKGE
jgi:hypothetical protein